MIAEFSVENFYSIRSKQTLSFIPTTDKTLQDLYTIEVKPYTRLLKIGMLYGANASGKSKVLQALEFLVRFLTTYPSSKIELTGVIPFMLDNHSKDEPSQMDLSFYIDGEKYVFHISFTKERILREELLVYASNRPAILYERTYIPGTDSSCVEFGKMLELGKNDKDIIHGNTLNNCSVLAAFGKSNVQKSRLNKIHQWLMDGFKFSLDSSLPITDTLHRQLKADNDGALKRFILNYLQNSDFNISDFRLSQDNSSILFSHSASSGAEGVLPENLESNGTLRFMEMSILLHTLISENRFMAIDEIESSLHYELLTFFLRTYLASSKSTSQLLFATHDINLMNEDFIRRDAIWFADKNKEAETQLIRLSALGLHKNISPYNAYRQGKLVNIPFTGNIYLQKEVQK